MVELESCLYTFGTRATKRLADVISYPTYDGCLLGKSLPKIIQLEQQLRRMIALYNIERRKKED